jgi:4-hydroxybenzoate polyprenyltransferase
VRRLLLRLAPVLHLTRVTTGFSVIADTWFVILWSRAERAHEGSPDSRLFDEPLWLLLLGGAAVGLGLFAFGAALNDILDLKRDRTLRPERPLPSGQISMEGALALVVSTLLLAVLGATVFGDQAVLLTLLLAAAIMIFNAAGKFVPAVGLVALGLIYAGHMLVPNVQLRFLWPLWLAMTHALVVAAITHRMARKVPRISRRAAVAAVVGWVFWSGVILWLQWHRDPAPRSVWPDWVPPLAAAWPAGLAVLFAITAWGKVRRYGPGPRAAEKVARYGSLWLALYACGWLVGAGHTNAAAVLLALTGAGLLGMTVLREAYGLVEQPLGYRR